jgi:periplasmic protein TonB
MDIKKHPQRDVDKKTFLLRQIGFIIALISVIVAFEWTTYDRVEFELEAEIHIDDDEEIADVTKQQEIPPPPPPPEIDVVEDDVEIEEDQPDLYDTELTEDFDMTFPDEQVEEVDETEIFTVVQDEPQFPGGSEALNRYLRENIQYPRSARERGDEGRVIVTFVVEPNGHITNVEIREGMGQTQALNDEAIRVVKSMPTWQPGRQQDRPVRVRVNLPITFRLR